MANQLEEKRKIHPRIPEILEDSGLKQGTKEYYELLRLLVDLSSTPHGIICGRCHQK